jgi:hypothetical protein
MNSKPAQKPGHQQMVTPSGTFQVFIPNAVMDGDGFYVSHNDYDHGAYGGETTALVVGQMEKFYILKGDHRQAYEPLIIEGFERCLDYFKGCPDLQHQYSDKLLAMMIPLRGRATRNLSAE